MASLTFFTFLLLSTLAPPAFSSTAYPSVSDTECSLSGGGSDDLRRPIRRDVYDNGSIIDITHRITSDIPSYPSEDGLGQYLWFPISIKKGNLTNNSMLKMPSHTGTHVDAPGHFLDHHFDAGFDVDALDLEVLNGPALVIDVPRDKNITAEVMEALSIPKGVRRVLFKTLNTDRGLMYQKQLAMDFTGFTEDGAKWLVENTDIKLIGIDYLSVAALDDLFPAHITFLETTEHIVIEGLKLDEVEPGLYSVHCLPPRLLGAEGSPVRCILIK